MIFAEAAGRAFSDNLVPAGLLTALVSLAGLFVRYLSKDRGAYEGIAAERRGENLDLRAQIVELEKECADERLAHAREIADVRDRHSKEIAGFQEQVLEQRRLKHDAINRALTAELTVSTVRLLSKNCTCQALTPLQQILDKENL